MNILTQSKLKMLKLAARISFLDEQTNIHIHLIHFISIHLSFSPFVMMCILLNLYSFEFILISHYHSNHFPHSEAGYKSFLAPPHFTIHLLPACHTPDSSISIVTIAPAPFPRCLGFTSAVKSILPELPAATSPANIPITSVHSGHPYGCDVVPGGFKLDETKGAGVIVGLPKGSWWRGNVLVRCDWDTPAGKVINPLNPSKLTHSLS